MSTYASDTSYSFIVLANRVCFYLSVYSLSLFMWFIFYFCVALSQTDKWDKRR